MVQETRTQTTEGVPQPARARIGTAEVLAALAGVKSGRVYDLGSELSAEMPQGPRDTFGGFRLTQYHVPRCLYQPDDPPPLDFSMEVITGSPHLGSHIDAFAHIQGRGRVFGGARAAEVFGDFGWAQNGMETVPPIVGRGILLDAARARGLERLPDDARIGPDELRECLARQGTEPRSGDTVLVRTGKFEDFRNRSEEYFARHAGVTPEGALWLCDQGMAVLGTDTTATEPYPFPDPAHTTHVAMLVEKGVHLLEILDLDELARDGVYEFLFICLPLKIVGATGSWVRPVAVV